MKYFLLALLACSVIPRLSAQHLQSGQEWLENYFRHYPKAQTKDTSFKNSTFRRLYRYDVDGIRDSLVITIESTGTHLLTNQIERVTNMYIVPWKDIDACIPIPGYPNVYTLVMINDRYFRVMSILPKPEVVRREYAQKLNIEIDDRVTDRDAFQINWDELTAANHRARR